MTISDPSSYEEPLYWVHVKTGKEYIILHHGLYENSLKSMVVYQRNGDTGGPVWVRPSEQFFDGRFVPNRTVIKYNPHRL